MSLSPYLACLWPGAAALWHKGDFVGLAWALPAAALFNFCLIATWVWPELVEPSWVNLGWLAVWAVWLVGAGISAWRMADYLPGRPDPTADELLTFAQEQYLQGDWFQAEATLVALLQAAPEDAEGRLLLGTMLRRTHKLPAAREELARLERLDAAARWRLELDRELAAIAELEEEAAAATEAEPAPSKKKEEPNHAQSTAELRVVPAEENNAAHRSPGSAGESSKSARTARRAA
jgi:hypothetical protein